MSTGTSTLTVSSLCAVPFDTQRQCDSVSVDFCFSPLLPYLLNVNFVMDEDGLSAGSEKEPGMCLRLRVGCRIVFN